MKTPNKMRFVTQIAYLAVSVFRFLRKGAEFISNKRMWKNIRFTEKEMNRILLEAEKRGQNPSEYIRSCVSGGLNDNPQFRKCLQELTYEIHKIGTNVNQIAYHNNTGIITMQEKELLLELMKDVRRGILEIAAYGNHKVEKDSE